MADPVAIRGPGGSAPSVVIFDNDGVLVDSEPLANRVLAELLSELGVATTAEEAMARYLGGTIGRVRDLVEAGTGWPLPAEFEARYYAGVFAAFRHGLRPVAGVPEVLQELDRAGQRYCVASSGSHERIRLALSVTGLSEHFGSHIYSAEDVPRGKPAPDLFLFAAAAMGVAPGECVVVEDSSAGMTAARAAGMGVFAYAPISSPLIDHSAADEVLTDMAALPGLLSR